MAKSFENLQGRAVEIAGYPCLVKPSAVRAWLMAGIIPQGLAEDLARYAPQVEQHGADSIDAMEVTRVLRQWHRFQIEYCVTTDKGRPFSFEREPGKICILDLENADTFVEEALAAIAGQPIQTVEGEVSATALTNFHADGNRTAEPVGAGVHGEDVSLPPVRAHRPARSGRKS